MRKKGERFHVAWWEIREDDSEDPPRPYWYGYCEGDKDGDRLNCGESLTLDPAVFPVGTRIDVEEPWDEEFYERLFDERMKRITAPSPPPPPSPTPEDPHAKEASP